ncbi:MAG: hypothetical protein AB1792_01015 [Candidatus Zixiibacteriota bacterium]
MATAATGALPRPHHGLLGRWKWRLWALAFDMTALGVIAALWHWPLVRVGAIIVDGPPAWRDEVVASVPLPPDSNLFRTDIDAIDRQLAAVFNDRALCQVRLQWPGTLAVRLVPILPVLRADGVSHAAPLAVAVSGALMTERPGLPALPIWRAETGSADDRGLGQQAKLAAGSWAEVVDADERYQHAISEWSHTADAGWTMIAADGRTRVLLGKSGLRGRAAAVAGLLERSDSLLLHPCLIDARFGGLIAVRPLAEPSDSAAADSLTTDRAAGRSRPAISGAVSAGTNTTKTRPSRARPSAKGTT